MNLNDYIMESMNDVDVMDIELAQIYAEMAVLEAMMDCYEKQEMLIEYNVDSAEEILMESALTVFTEEKTLEEADRDIRKAIADYNSKMGSASSEGQKAGAEYKNAGKKFSSDMKASGSSAKDTFKTFGKGVGSFFERMWKVTVKLIANLCSIFFATKFNKLAEKVNEMDIDTIDLLPAEYRIVNEFPFFTRQISTLDKIVDKLDSSMNDAELKHRIVTLNSALDAYEKDIAPNKNDAERNTVSKANVVKALETLGDGELKRQMNGIKYAIGKWNMEWSEQERSKEDSKALRKIFTRINKLLKKNVSALSKIYKIAKKQNATAGKAAANDDNGAEPELIESEIVDANESYTMSIDDNSYMSESADFFTEFHTRSRYLPLNKDVVDKAKELKKSIRDTMVSMSPKSSREETQGSLKSINTQCYQMCHTILNQLKDIKHAQNSDATSFKLNMMGRADERGTGYRDSDAQTLALDQKYTRTVEDYKDFFFKNRERTINVNEFASKIKSFTKEIIDPIIRNS